MNEIEIRLYRSGDEAAVIGLWQECGLVTPSNHPRADIARKCADSADLFFVGVDQGRVIASCMAGYDGHRGWIYYLAVAAAWRRRGIARALVAYAQTRLRERGCPKIDLMVRQGNREVISFYHAIGYADDPVVVLSKRLLEDDEHDFALQPRTDSRVRRGAAGYPAADALKATHGMKHSDGNDTPVLLLIDVQKGLDEPRPGQRNNPRAEANMARLLERWRQNSWPTVHIRHDSTEAESPLRPELPGNAYKDEIRPLPGETEFRKSVNSAFVGTGLEAFLRDRGLLRLVAVGLTTDHCVSATVRSAADLGFDVTLVADACAAFGRDGFDGRHYSGDEIHRVNLVSLDGEFCRLRLTAELLGESSARTSGD